MTQIESYVDQLFTQLPRPANGIDAGENPVTGAGFVWGADKIEPQKREACRALRAREWFAKNGPPDVQPLPLHHQVIEDLRYQKGPLLHLLASYARSVRGRDWDIEGHPLFDVYARGVLASPYAPAFLMQDEGLRKRFPPGPITGEIGRDLCWHPAKARSAA